MKFIYHTDGNVNAVLPLYLEAGFDCLQPLEAKATWTSASSVLAMGSAWRSSETST